MFYLQDMLSPSSSTSSLVQETHEHFDGYNIVSEQSTSRPGCIIELDALKAAEHVRMTQETPRLCSL